MLTLLKSRKYPMPNWAVEYEQLKEKKLERVELEQFWDVRCREWVRLLRESLGSEYQAHESTHFWLLCSQDLPTAEKLLRWAEKCYAQYARNLAGIAPPKVGRIPMVVLKDLDYYYEYISEYYPDGEHAHSAGVYLYQGYGHFAFCFQGLNYAERVIAHELIHAFLLGLKIPLWLNEGIAQVAEMGMTQQGHVMEDAFIHYWNSRTIQGFWRGAWFDPKNPGPRHCYYLAVLLTRRLTKDMNRFREFVKMVRREDAGYAAMLEVYGVRMEDLVAEHLGPGDWIPAGAGGRWKAQDNLHY